MRRPASAKVNIHQAGAFRWATGEALVDAGLLEPQHYGPNTVFVPTIVAHTVAALLKDA